MSSNLKVVSYCKQKSVLGSSTSGWGSSLEFKLGSLDFSVTLVSELGNSVSSVESGSDLLVSLDESLQLSIKVFVLPLKDVAMWVKSIQFSFQILVSLHDITVTESHIFLFLSGYHQLVLDLSLSLFSLIQLSWEISVLRVFDFGLSLQVSFVGELAIQIALQSLRFNHKSWMVILGSLELCVSSIKGFVCSSKFKLFRISKFGQFVCSLLSLIEIIIDTLDSRIVVLAISLLGSDLVSDSVDFFLVFCLFLSHLGKLVLEIISVFSESVGLICLGTSLSGKRNAFLLSSTNLISNGGNFGLVFVIRAVLLIE